MKESIKYSISLALIFGGTIQLFSQAIPSEDENIPYIITFGKNSSEKYGDDDFVQTLFFVIPEKTIEPFYIRVYDADVGGLLDEKYGAYSTKSKFSFYGGKGAFSTKDAKEESPRGNYKSGVLLSSKIFGEDIEADSKWYEFGPFNPKEGELQTEVGGYVFKMIVEGLEGDDGNLYKVFLSSNKNENVKVEGANSFCYEYTFRLDENPKAIAHIYPYVPTGVVTCEINIFDFDNAGVIRVVSVAKKGEVYVSQTEGVWSVEKFQVSKEEINTSLDIQFINNKVVKNNNVAVYIKNQYGELMPFYTSPIGGVPKFKYKIGVKPSK